MHSTPNPIKPTESPPKLPRKARLLKRITKTPKKFANLKKNIRDINKKCVNHYKKNIVLCWILWVYLIHDSFSVSSSSASRPYRNHVRSHVSMRFILIVYDGMDIHSLLINKSCQKIVEIRF